MDIVEAIAKRKSIRMFKPTPIPRGTLEKVLNAAIRSPSGMNTQPWSVTVVSGHALEKIKKDNVAALDSREQPQSEVPFISYQDEYKRRQVDLAIQLFGLMDIARDDKQKRQDWQRRGFRFFDAPAAILVSIDRSLDGSATSLMDIGSFAQTVCLAAMEYGLGTCIEGQGVLYSQAVRKHIGLPESKRLATCIAIGYPDWDFPANRIETPREPLDKVVDWVE